MSILFLSHWGLFLWTQGTSLISQFLLNQWGWETSTNVRSGFKQHCPWVAEKWNTVAFLLDYTFLGTKWLSGTFSWGHFPAAVTDGLAFGSSLCPSSHITCLQSTHLHLLKEELIQKSKVLLQSTDFLLTVEIFSLLNCYDVKFSV